MFTVTRARDCAPVLAGNITPSPHARSQEVHLLVSVDVMWAFEAVVGSGMVLGVVVPQIDVTWSVVDKELLLGFTILDPVEAHVDGFGSFLFDGFVGKPDGGGVVNLDGGGRLGMAHSNEGGSDRDGLFTVEESGSNFCLGGGRHDRVHDEAQGADGAVEKSYGSRYGVRGAS